MINNNMEMIKEVAKTSSIYDYDVYVELCTRDSITIRPKHQYLQGISYLEYGLYKNGGDWQEAYAKGIDDINNTPQGDTECCDDKVKEEKVESLGVIDTVKSLGISVGEHIRNKLSHVTNKEANRRLNICSKCPKSKEGLKCSVCHCYMGIKATWDIKGICKLNKW